MTSKSRFNCVAVNLVVLLLLGAFAVSAWADKPARPFKGTGVAISSVAEPDPDLPFLVNLVVEWEGVASHLGKFQRTDYLLFNFVEGTLVGAKTFTAANGDELHVLTEGTFDASHDPSEEDPLLITGTYCFIGGTGRFADATGTASYEVLTPDFQSATVSFEGVLDY